MSLHCYKIWRAYPESMNVGAWSDKGYEINDFICCNGLYLTTRRVLAEPTDFIGRRLMYDVFIVGEFRLEDSLCFNFWCYY